jgi:hypothetical protein
MGVAATFITQVWSRIDQVLVIQVAAVTLLFVVAFLSGRYFGRRVSPNVYSLVDTDFLSCVTCDRPLREPGGILLGPPTKDGFARQQHICVQCYPLFVATVVSMFESSERLKDRVILQKGQEP